MKSQDEKLQQLKDETYQTARYVELLEANIGQAGQTPYNLLKCNEDNQFTDED